MHPGAWPHTSPLRRHPGLHLTWHQSHVSAALQGRISHSLFFEDAEFTTPFVTPICTQQLANYTLVIKADQTMKDSESPGSELSFIPADSRAHPCASNETIISRIPTMHIKRVLNWEAFEYPQQFNESWGTAGTVIGTRAQVIKVTVHMSGKADSNSQCIAQDTLLSMSNRSYDRETFENSRSPESNARPQR